MKFLLTRIGLILVTISVPFFLIMTAIHLLMLPWYPQVEYRMPYFPADEYGFSMGERLKWAGLSIDYLNNQADISFLADLRLQDGNPLYNERELSHMYDVKVLVQKMYLAWDFMVVLYAGVFIFAGLRGGMRLLWGALATGGKATITSILCILALVAVSFDWLFTMFHRLFFTGSTWIFLYSDSLIRLFPLPFWRDGFIVMGIFTIVPAVLLIIFGGRASRVN
jgi:integral membrane protein (TIGR01906 family)